MKNLMKSAVIILLMSVVVNAQGGRYLKELQNKFNSIKDLTAKFEEHTNEKMAFEGQFLYKKKDKVKFDLKNLLIVSDGTTNWNYIKKNKKVFITSFDTKNPSAVVLERIINEFPSKCKVTESMDKGAPLIELKPEADAGINAYYIKLWLNGEKLLRKVEIKTTQGILLNFSFSDYKINAGIPDSEFSFTPPKGTKVIDAR